MLIIFRVFQTIRIRNIQSGWSAVSCWESRDDRNSRVRMFRR